MISNIVIITVILLFAVIGTSRGAARTLLNLAAVAASVMISNFISVPIAGAIYQSFIKPAVISNLESAIKSGGEQLAAQNSIQSLPDGARGYLGFFTGLFGLKPEELQGRLLPSQELSTQAAQTIEKPLGDLMTGAISLLVSFIFFVLLMIVFKLIIRKISGVFRLPVINQINRILGFIIGLAEGLVIVCVVANIIYYTLSYTQPAALENSSLFGGVFNFFVVLD